MDQTLTKHRVAWKHFLNFSDQNLLRLQVVDAKTGQPAAASISIASIPHVQGEKAFSTNSAGYYFKVLDQGVYALTVRLADGRQAQASVKMDEASTEQMIQVVVP